MTKTKNKKLRELLIAYPDLPIIASVNSEVVADDGYADWYGDVEKIYCTKCHDAGQLRRE